jgi:transposase
MRWHGYIGPERRGVICLRYGDWKYTNRRFCRWRDKGLWQRLASEMLGEVDTEWLMLDSSCIKVHPDGCGAGGGNQVMGRTKGG